MDKSRQSSDPPDRYIGFLLKAVAVLAAMICMSANHLLLSQGNYPRVSYQFDYTVDLEDAFVLKSGNIIFSTREGIIVKIDRNGLVLDTMNRGENYSFPIEALTDSTFIISYNLNYCDISSYPFYCLVDTNLKIIWKTNYMHGNSDNLFGNISRISDSSFIVSSEYGGMRLYYGDSTTNPEFDSTFWDPGDNTNAWGIGLPAGGEDFIHSHGKIITLYEYKPFSTKIWKSKSQIFASEISGLEYHPAGGYAIASGSELIFLTADNEIRKTMVLSSEFDTIMAMESDSLYFYLTGRDTSNGILRLAKYDSSGSLVWITYFGNKVLSPISVLLRDSMVAVTGNEYRSYYCRHAFVWNFSRTSGLTQHPNSNATIDSVSIDSVSYSGSHSNKLRLDVKIRNSGSDTLNSIYLTIASRAEWCFHEGTRIRFDSLCLTPGSNISIQTNLMNFNFLLHYLYAWENRILKVIVSGPNEDLDADPSDDLYLFEHGLVGRSAEVEREMIKVWPNPTSGNVNISFDDNSFRPVLVSLHDPLRKFLEKLIYTNNSFDLDLNDYPSGIYFLEIEKGDNRIARKIILVND